MKAFRFTLSRLRSAILFSYAFILLFVGINLKPKTAYAASPVTQTGSEDLYSDTNPLLIMKAEDMNEFSGSTGDSGYSQASYYGEGYYQGYYQGTYYSQSTYYSQGGYYDPAGTTTLTKSSVITGNASVNGALAKGSGTFVIDDPIDPKNKLLYHSFVESPDVKNIYDGTVVLDANGAATIQLPSYFLALNKDFRYLASPIKVSMPNLHRASPIHRRYFFFGPIEFSLSGGVPNAKVSWQVTGIRHDPLIEANPIIPEVAKTDSTVVKKGECLYEPLCK